MNSLSIITLFGVKKLAFIQTIKPNGYITVVDRENNSIDIHNTYITDLRGYPRQQKKAMNIYGYANFSK